MDDSVEHSDTVMAKVIDARVAQMEEQRFCSNPQLGHS